MYKLSALFFFITAMSLMASCDRQKDLSLATHRPETALAAIGEHLAEVLSANDKLTVSALAGPEYSGTNNKALVEQGKVDLAISTSVLAVEKNSDIRTVLPLYPEIIVVMFHPSLGEPASLIELLRDRRVGVGPDNNLHSEFIIQMLADFGVPRSEYTPVFSPVDEMRISTGKMDVFITIAGANRTRIEEEIRSGAKLFSLDDYRLAGLGSRVDGYLLHHPGLQSYIIPKNSIEQFPEEPILTLAIPITLIAHKDMPAETVYEIVETILSNASYLAHRDPMLGFLSYRFDTTRLAYPLHEGTQRYLRRDEPGFLERYAELMALLVTLLLLTFGAVSSAGRVIRHRKKNRIDNYYQAVEAISKQTTNDSEGLRQGLTMLADLKSRAVEQLRHETLQADESFSIFLAMVHDTSNRFQQKLRDRADIGIDEID